LLQGRAVKNPESREKAICTAILKRIWSINLKNAFNLPKNYAGSPKKITFIFQSKNIILSTCKKRREVLGTANRWYSMSAMVAATEKVKHSLNVNEIVFKALDELSVRIFVWVSVYNGIAC